MCFRIMSFLFLLTFSLSAADPFADLKALQVYNKGKKESAPPRTEKEKIDLMDVFRSKRLESGFIFMSDINVNEFSEIAAENSK